MVGARYQLLERLAPASAVVLGVWRGQDTVLNRPVTITVAEPGGGAAAALLGHAHALSLIEHPSLPRVFDAADEGRRAWVVTEWVDGGTLGSMLVDGPFDPRATAAAVARLAEGVALAHRAGLTVGLLDPDHVAITPRGSVTVTRLAVGSQPRLEDVRLLGALIYVMLTGHWPAVHQQDPASPGWIPHPRQVRAGVPTELSEIAMRALEAGQPSGLASAADVAEALNRWHHDAEPEPMAGLLPVEERYPDSGRGRRRRLAPIAAFVAGFCAIGLTALLVNAMLGGKPDTPPKSTAHSDTPTTTAAPSLTPLSVRSVAMYDPLGDGQENASAAPLTIDHNPQTVWPTLQYKRDARFGNLKAGVGLIFDLGQPTQLRQVDLVTTEPGTDIEIRVGDVPGGPVDSYQVIGQQSGLTAHTVITLRPNLTGRYVVVWFTRLAPAGSLFQGNLAEVGFLT